MKSYRPLKPNELEIINRLLEPNFPGRDELVIQLRSATVQEIDEDGGLSIKCDMEPKAPVKVTVVSEGEYPDADGTKVHVLLHVGKGVMNELEIYKEDGSKVINPPIAQNLTLFAPYSEAGVDPDYWSKRSS